MDADFLLAYHHVNHHVHHSHARSTPRTYRSSITNDFGITHKQGEYAAFGIVGTLLLFVVLVLVYNHFNEK